MSYTYTRTTQYVDIPANPGFKARLNRRYSGLPQETFLDVIAWRINQSDDRNPLGAPIVVGPKGLLVLNPHQYGDDLEFIFPGQEVPE